MPLCDRMAANALLLDGCLADLRAGARQRIKWKCPMSNPLLESHRLPPFDRIRPEHVVPALDTILAENRATIAALGKLPAAAGLGWQAVPAVLEKLQDRIDQFWAPVSHMNKVMNSEAWRAAYNAILPRMAEYSTELARTKTCSASTKRWKNPRASRPWASPSRKPSATPCAISA